jgi:F0F1-type ATP synthase membrane subunit c/vacuolar-type H+-ATPase subunit K
MHQMTHEEDTMTTKFFRYGGIAASIVLIAFGIGAVAIGYNGRDQVRTELAREQIVGTPDSSIPGQKVDTGSEAQAFAKVMRKHTLEATGGQTYAQMGQFLDKAGKPTSDDKLAAVDPKTQKPVANPARQIWVTETALTTALNTAYFAESTALFAIVMGFALLLVGVGFLVLTLIALRRPATASKPGWSASRAAPSVG